ncbi:MAG: tRNA pseudouridine(55) synthase TruB [Melioribacteraceae bacterium]|nr:tRNA pseudouridine(55) synthase TruB [Melioribacteraceae bacterium]
MVTKKTKSDCSLNFENGEVILIDKQFRKTSFDIVHKVRKYTGVKKVGHAGTLDPMATGLVIVCTGKKTKEINEYQNFDKTYEGTITIGKTTPSYDLETEYDAIYDYEFVNDELIYKVSEKFKGLQKQTPPMYSAIKKNGKPLYELARKGVEVERKEREIFINSFQIKKIELPDIFFEINCSKGTYIRVIANEFGKILGCGAHLTSLRRTKIGNYSVDDALTIYEFIELTKKIAIN